MEHLIEASEKPKLAHHNITYNFRLPSRATMVRRVSTEPSGTNREARLPDCSSTTQRFPGSTELCLLQTHEHPAVTRNKDCAIEIIELGQIGHILIGFGHKFLIG